MIRRATELLGERRGNEPSLFHSTASTRAGSYNPQVCKTATCVSAVLVKCSFTNKNAGAGGRHMSHLRWVLLFCLWFVSCRASIKRASSADNQSGRQASPEGERTMAEEMTLKPSAIGRLAGGG